MKWPEVWQIVTAILIAELIRSLTGLIMRRIRYPER